MHRTRLVLVLLGLSLFCSALAPDAPAQSTNSGSSTNLPSVRPFWRAELPGGTYTVALAAITSVSIHDYLVDGSLAVTEVVIDTGGSTTCRFYSLNKVNVPTPGGIGQTTIQEGLKQADRLAQTATGTTSGTAPWKQVVKNYPATTHARTVEYRLDTKEDCEALFNSADEAWRRNNTRIFQRR